MNTNLYIIRCAIKCPDSTILETKHSHDYQTHLDAVTGEVYILDGGGYYYRTSVNKVPATMLMITTDDPFELQRTIPFWRSFGKDGEHYPEGVRMSLEQMEDDHLFNILDTQQHIKGTAVERMFINEVEYRKLNKEV